MMKAIIARQNGDDAVGVDGWMDGCERGKAWLAKDRSGWRGQFAAPQQPQPHTSGLCLERHTGAAYHDVTGNPL